MSQSPENTTSGERSERHNAEVEEIIPKVEELLKTPETNIVCTVPGCSRIIATRTALKMHLNKTHRIYENPNEERLFIPERGEEKRKKKTVTKVYFCPVDDCLRASKSKRPFATLQLVKQHYMKIHAEKKMFCSKCQKGFSTKTDHARHEKTCGTLFRCSCGCPYSTRSALLTHIKRQGQGHSLPQEPQQEPATIIMQRQTQKMPPSTTPTILSNRPTTQASASPSKTKKTYSPILPKPSVQYVPVILAVPVGMPVTSLPKVNAVTMVTENKSTTEQAGYASQLSSINRASQNGKSVATSVCAPPTSGVSSQSISTTVAKRQTSNSRKRRHATTQTSTGVRNRTSKNTQTHVPTKRQKVKHLNSQNFKDSGINTNLPDLNDFQISDFQDIETQTPGDYIIKQSLMSVDMDTQTNEHLLGLSVDAYTNTSNSVTSMETQTHGTMLPSMITSTDPQVSLSNVHTQTHTTVNTEMLDLNIQPTVSSETQTLLAMERPIQGSYDMADMLTFPDVNASQGSVNRTENSASVTSSVTQTDTQGLGAYPGLSDSQTQTLRLLQDLDLIMASESSSTQTQESYLNEAGFSGQLQNQTVQTQTRRADVQELNTNSVQTETMEFDFADLIANQGSDTACVDFNATDSDVEFLDSYAQTNLNWQLYNGADNFTQTTTSLLLDTEVANIHTQTSETLIRTPEDSMNNMTTQTQTVSSAGVDISSSEQSDRQVQVDLQTLIKCNDSHTQTAISNHLTDSVEQTDMQTQTFGEYSHFLPSSTELADTETQTLFSDLGISTNSLTDSHTQTYFQ
ncbi:ATM interactor-like [Ptychodera flava]|uniref:ATM interactor-like n=1 Tax=Ptychodera flava TaxID=63121 RepID=UPI003969EB46